MAAQVVPLQPSATVTSTINIHNFFVNSLDLVLGQITNGIAKPVVRFTDITTLGEEGVRIWHKYIQEKTGTQFLLTVNVVVNTVELTPLGPMSDVTGSVADLQSFTAADDSQFSSSPAAETPPTSDSLDTPEVKIARPPNAFIIYRKEWHPKVMKEHPTWHNNDVSKLLGRKWKAEPEAVKNEYKLKAEDAKRQHAIDHPGYQYQPRKPSEKKKRMTKHKLAKMRADAATAQNPMHAHLSHVLSQTGQQVTIDTYHAPYRQGFPCLEETDRPANCLTYDSAGAVTHENMLMQQVEDWNLNNPIPSGPHPNQLAIVGQSLANGSQEGANNYSYMDNAPVLDFTTSSAYTLVNPVGHVAQSVGQAAQVEDAFVYQRAAQANTNPYEFAEPERQATFDDLFDFNGYGATNEPLFGGEDAEDVLNQLESSFELDNVEIGDLDDFGI